MQEIQYKSFSLRTHKKNWKIKKPNVCQFELTFGCGLHCRHCYTDCYNNPVLLKDELNARDVLMLLDKIYDAGIIWVCFTGGDPFTRADFLEIYDYAKHKGFIVILFTNGYSMTQKIARHLAKNPPFVIEITLNAVTEDLYEKITQVKGSFSKAMNGINLIVKAKLPLKIKTQITEDNLKDLPRIKKYIKGLGLKFRPSIDLHAGLNKDPAPCSLRISPEEVLNLNNRRKDALTNDCQMIDSQEAPDRLFNCAITGGDSIHIDPYGNTFPCICIREPRINLLREDIKIARDNILSWIRSRTFTHNSECRTCLVKGKCGRCPGKSLLETDDMEAPVPYYCELARATARERDNV